MNSVKRWFCYYCGLYCEPHKYFHSEYYVNSLLDDIKEYFYCKKCFLKYYEEIQIKEKKVSEKNKESAIKSNLFSS